MVKKIVIAFFIAIVILLISPEVNAQQNTPEIFNFDASLSVTPATNEIKIDPGKKASDTIELTNKLDKPLAIRSYIRVFDASDEVGGMEIFDKPDVDRLSQQSWIKIISSDFLLEPRETRKIQIVYNPPANIEPGGYYSVLFCEPQVESNTSSSSLINVGGRIGALLFTTISGDIQESGELISFQTSRWQFWRTPMPFIIRVQNNGNVHLRPQGKITLTNIITRHKTEIKVPQFTILPQKVRSQEVVNSIGKYPALYSAKIKLGYGQESKQSADNNIVFIYFSWPYLFAIILLLAIVGVFGINARGRKKFIAAIRVLFSKK